MNYPALVSSVALVSLTVAASAAGQTCDASPLAIRNVAVWTRDGVLRDRTVFARDGRVASIAQGGPAMPPAMRVVDGAGHTLLPGLIDSHLHFSVPGGLPATSGRRADTNVITGRQLLRSGVTSGRLHLATLEEAVDLKRRGGAPCAELPRLQVGGPGLSGAAERDAGSFQGARTAADAAAKVARFRAAGVEWLAVHDADRFEAGVLAALGAAARRVGLRLMAAGSTPREIAAALTISPDTLDYFDRTGRAGADAAILDAMRARPGLVLVPTPGVPYRTARYLAQPGLLDRPESFALFSPPDRAFVLANARKDLASAEAAGSTPIAAALRSTLASLRATGVPMAIGSDAGSPLQLQPDAVWWELEAWRAARASHREALTAATWNGALVLGRTDVGRIEAGARADFVLYRGNVEEGPFDARRVAAVVKDGVLFVKNGVWLGSAR